ncbi:MAG: PQQ-binding-like beta-propeller repeat protein [Desulfobacteraceae bacterium]|nr:PQQ-binding-like beta-propeller repeat protein [Desulfobacteraceae bacterium]
MIKFWFIVILLIFSYATAGFGATVNFTVSEQYVVKGDKVEFTFTFDPQGNTSAAALLMELNYDNDPEMEYTNRLDPIDGRIVERAQITIDQAGYFQPKAFFTLQDANGDRIDRLNLGPVELNVANWRFTAGGNLGCIESTPALQPEGGTVYFGSADHCIYAVTAQNGTMRWRRCVEQDVSSSPSVDSQGYVYVGSEEGNVYCLEPATGTIAWQFPAGAQTAGAFLSSPALYEEQNRLYIGSTDGYLYALNMNDGSLEWRFKTGAKIVSSPVVGFDHTIYIGSLDTFLYAVNPDGTRKWRFDAASEIRGSPALDKDGTIFFGTASFQGEYNENNGLYALSTTGQQKWFLKNANGFPSSPIIGYDGTLVIGSWDNKIYGIKRRGGDPIMYKTFNSDMISAPALADGGYLFAGAKDRSFYGLEFEEGDQRSGRAEFWLYRTVRPITTSAPVVGNGYVYVGTCENDGGSGSGALYSFLCNNGTGGADLGPATDAPWPQIRNLSGNSGLTEFRTDTVAPEVTGTDPASGVQEFDITRRSITARFSMPMESDSIYDPGNDRYSFTVEPFDITPEDFIIDWNAEQTVFTLTLPEGESFEREKEYTATIKSGAHAEGEVNRNLLYDYEWTFKHDPEESHDNSHNRFTCFISSIWETSSLDFMADLW